jgi:hypothetical protein
VTFDQSDTIWARPRLRPDLYGPNDSTPRPLAAGGTVETKPQALWSDEHGVFVVTGLDGSEYVACGSGPRKLVPLVDVVARASSRGYTVDRAASSWEVGA